MIAALNPLMYIQTVLFDPSPPLSPSTFSPPTSDLNECNVDDGGCTQVCENTAGSFQCSCLSGFRLEADDKTCTGTERNSSYVHVVLRIFHSTNLLSRAHTQ